MVIVAQSVRASDCGSEGRGFESHLSPKTLKRSISLRVFLLYLYQIYFFEKDYTIY